MTRPRRLPVVALILALAGLHSMRAEENPGAQTARLRIVVIEGEAAVNIIQQKTAVAPVVEVRDRNDQPVAGAVVQFTIRGGRATFGGARTLTLTTNAAGRAVAAGLTPTGAGAVQIGASAVFEGQTAVATIVQTNVLTAAQGAGAASAGGGGGLSGAAIGGIAAGAGGAVAAVALTQKNGDTSGTAPPTASAPSQPRTDSFSGTTGIQPGIQFQPFPSQPAFTVSAGEQVIVNTTFSAPADCQLRLWVCPAPAISNLNCTGGPASTGAAGVFIRWFPGVLPAGSYQFQVRLESFGVPQGPACQAFGGAISYSGTVTHQ